MKHGMVLGLFGTVLFFFYAPPTLVAQSTFNLLYSFTATPASSPYTNSDGTFPRADLIQSGGTLYGTASQGGAGYGTVFSIGTNGMSFTNLHSFVLSEGAILYGGLVLSGNTLYGAAMDGGSLAAGTIFSLNTNGMNFTVLHTFPTRVYDSTLNTYTNSDGVWPRGSLVLSGNTLYGTTSLAGKYGNGSVFAFNLNTMGFTNLYNFTTTVLSIPLSYLTNTDGATPHAGLILSGNTLYGTTSVGGYAGKGSVFSINTDGSGFTNLYNFTAVPQNQSTNSDGASPQAGLVLSGNTLYGTTWNGGSSGFGTVFSLNTNGTGFAALHSFAPTNGDGILAVADLIVSGNTLFGTESHGGSVLDGSVFSINTDGTDFKNLYAFTSTTNSTNSDGAIPEAGLYLLGNTLYGVAAQGGGAGHGTVFSLSMVPTLGIAPTGNQAVISWPPWASNYGLQTATNLSSGSWSNVTSGITTVNAGYVFTNTMNGHAAFFRLKAQ
jgi:uncharacterized repeat protein (TIGR03803 family)